MSSLKNITKMEYPAQGLRGYNVRIQRDGKKEARFFSASNCGSMEKARAEAISYRDAVLERWKQYCGGKDETIQYQGTNTGYPGISLTHDHGHPILEINLRDVDGSYTVRNIGLPPKSSPNYKKIFKETFEEAKAMVDKYNRKRFGGRWHQYKKRKAIID